MNQITIVRPDDWHVHFRDGDMMLTVVPETARHFGRAIVMPNLVPPVVTRADANAYRGRIEAALKERGIQDQFKPLMTLYLTEKTDPKDVIDAAASGDVQAVKLYPAGATTNSASGVANIDNVMPVLEAMAENGIVLCIHGEVTNPKVDIFDREARFIEDVLQPLRKRLPNLRVVMEHITTKHGADYVSSEESNLAATITPQHLLLNRNHMLVGGIRPHYYCLPILKREEHRKALVDVACSGDNRFFLGTDSAPHEKHTKENSCGCAGVFNSTVTMACMAQLFEQQNSLDRLEAFCSINGPAYYGLPLNDTTITLRRTKEPVKLPEYVTYGEITLAVFDPAQHINWQVV
ncbi:MAG: dihydroorotase [Granulosicoccaceae bacterium]